MGCSLGSWIIPNPPSTSPFCGLGMTLPLAPSWACFLRSTSLPARPLEGGGMALCLGDQGPSEFCFSGRHTKMDDRAKD